MSDDSLKINTIINGTSVVQTYLRNGINLPVQGIEEYLVLETGAITANTTKTLNTSDHGHTFKLESIWVDTSIGTNYAIDFDVLWGTNVIFTFTLNSNQIPFSFPPVIITNTLNIRVTPKANIDRILVYARPVAVFDRLIFP